MITFYLLYYTENMAAVVNISMYFKLIPNCIENAETWQKVLQMGKLCLGEMTTEPIETVLGATGGRMLIFHNPPSSHATLVLYDDGMLTLDIQHRSGHVECYNTAYIRGLEHKLAEHLAGVCLEHNGLHCPIKRGLPFWPYAVSADERLLELDHEELVFETNSRWQNIRIFRSRHSGNVLFLDGDAMLGEGDLIYTKTLCRIGHENYRGKTVLVLGGGDGGILNELLKENPAFITVAEIDEEVIKACRVHMCGACGNSLDSLSGDNYEIRIEDCMKVMRESYDKGIQYDYVINDLTEFPVDKSSKGFDYDFSTTATVMQLSLSVLKPGGKILARGNCQGAIAYRKVLEADIAALGCQFVRRDVYVPSFHEVYCLYEIFRSDDVPQSDHINSANGDIV